MGKGGQASADRAGVVGSVEHWELHNQGNSKGPRLTLCFSSSCLLALSGDESIGQIRLVKKKRVEAAEEGSGQPETSPIYLLVRGMEKEGRML